MALKDIWKDQDNTMDADAEIVNSIAHAVITLEEKPPSGGTNLTEEQIANIAEIPNKVDKKDGYGLCNVREMIITPRNTPNVYELQIYDYNGEGTGVSFYNQRGIDALLGDIETALDNIIDIQNELMGVSK